MLDNNTMLRTANKEIYEEFIDIKKYFNRRIHLFVTGLIIGIVNKRISGKRPNRDIIRMGQLDPNLSEFKILINLISDILCLEKEEDCSNIIFKYADGGLELL